MNSDMNVMIFEYTKSIKKEGRKGEEEMSNESRTGDDYRQVALN